MNPSATAPSAVSSVVPTEVTVPKRIIICCDGTWQSAVSGLPNCPSNVTRLARTLARAGPDPAGKIWQQVVWYDSGIGTTSSAVGARVEGAVGRGIEGNVIEAYNFIVLNWSPGDQVMCFGFSRGAYTARSVAGLVSDIGICEPRQLHDFPHIWKLYKATRPGERFRGTDAYFEWAEGKLADQQPADPGYKNANLRWDSPPHGEWARTVESREVEVVGVFDTVGSLGLPSIHGLDPKKLPWPFGPDKTGFHNVQLNPNIKRAFHALALDEHREAFTPTLWYLPDSNPTTGEALAEKRRLVSAREEKWHRVRADPKASAGDKIAARDACNNARRDVMRMEESRMDEPELVQVWFPGVHINIGGGDPDTLHNKGDLEEMSNITFAWMLDRIRTLVSLNDTLFNQERRARQNHIDELNRQIEEYRRQLGEQKEAQAKEGWAAWARRSAHAAAQAVVHPLAGNDAPDLRRRDYGWGTGTLVESFTLMYLPNGSKPRTPGGYGSDPKHPAPGRTCESIHPTTGYRMKKTAGDPDEKLRYHPVGDSDAVRQPRVKGGKEHAARYVIGGVALPEWEIMPTSESGPPSYERLAVEGMEAEEYLSRLDLEKTVSMPMRPVENLA